MNTRDNKNVNRTIHREYTDSEGNIHTEYKDIHGNIYTEYRDSLGNFHSDQNDIINSKLTDAHIESARVERADKNTSKGLLIGVIVTVVVGLIAGIIYFLNDVNNPQPVSVVNVPTQKTDSTPNPTPTQVKIVEKEVVKIVPVEVSVQTSAPVTTKAPEAKNNPSTVNNNITVKPSESNTPPKENSNKTPAAKPVVAPLSNNAINPTKTDEDLRNEIMKKFQGNFPNNQLNVAVKNSEVIVSGNVETQEQIQQIKPLMSSIEGIKKLEIKATVANNMNQ